MSLGSACRQVALLDDEFSSHLHTEVVKIAVNWTQHPNTELMIKDVSLSLQLEIGAVATTA